MGVSVSEGEERRISFIPQKLIPKTTTPGNLVQKQFKSVIVYVIETEITVRAEIVTELTLERAGPVIFKTFLLELLAFRLIPVIFLQEEESLKITGHR